MTELINKYVANPTEENKARLLRYLKQHPLAECFATKSELKVIKKLKNKC